MGKPSPGTGSGTPVGAAPGTGSTKVVSTNVRIKIISGAEWDFTTIVGKRVVLAAVDGDDGDKEIAGHWHVENTADGRDVVKDYDCDWTGPPPATAAVHLLTQKDMQSGRLELYWVKGGEKHLSFTTGPEHGSLTLNATIQVAAPVVMVATGTTTSVALRPGIPETETWIGLGNHLKVPEQWPGIRFTYCVLPPRHGDGQIAGVQLIWTKTTVVDTMSTHTPLWQDYWLDSGAPYHTANEVKGNVPGTWAFPEDYDNGLGTHRDIFDTPGRYMQIGWTEYHADEHYRMFLMYRPKGDGKESIWVTLACIEWSWQGDAYCPDVNDNKWHMPISNWSSNPSGVQTSELPHWDKAFVRENAREYWKPAL